LSYVEAVVEGMILLRRLCRQAGFEIERDFEFGGIFESRMFPWPGNIR